MVKKGGKKNEAAAALAGLRWAAASKEERQAVGRIASLGGKSRAATLSAKRRKEIAKKAAAARWGKKK